MNVLGIDASNLSRGGGVTHIYEFLKATDHHEKPFEKIFVYGSLDLLNQIEDYDWLFKISHSFLNGGIVKRVIYLCFLFRKQLNADGVDVLFAPGGLYLGGFRPFITMSRNMLVFEKVEAARYGLSKTRFRLAILRILQKLTFNRAEKVIFISKYANDYVNALKDVKINRSEIINHGISRKFRTGEVRKTYSIDNYSYEKPFQLVYVSILDVYKHQDSLIKAVNILRKQNYPLELTLVGGEYPPYAQRVNNLLSTDDFSFVKLTGNINYKDMSEIYRAADLLVFASSCENMPNILMEAMGSGVAIACSNRGPMPEFLEDAGEYFDPEDPISISKSIEKLLIDPELRKLCATKAHKLTEKYTWVSCAEKTMKFISLN